MLVLSAAVALAGLGLWAYAAASQGTEPAAAAPSVEGPGATDPLRSVSPQGFAPVTPGSPDPGAPAESAAPAPDGLAVWSPAIFRLGFGFFAGFCMAYALRAFMKATILVIGAALLGLFGLQYAGLVDVNWGAMEGVYNSAASWVSAQTASFSRFVAGYLPTAASSAAGFAAGFTTRR